MTEIPLFAEKEGVAVPFADVIKTPTSRKCPHCKQRIRRKAPQPGEDRPPRWARDLRRRGKSNAPKGCPA